MGVVGDKSGQTTVNRQQVPSTNYQLTNNYVGSAGGGNKVQASQLISGNNVTNSSSMTITTNK